MTDTPPLESPKQNTPGSGVLVALVYRDGPWVIYLAHGGAHPLLELDANIRVGGEWEEAQVLYEERTPMPPQENGLWELRYPWRAAVHCPKDWTPDHDTDPDEYDAEELCCVYNMPPRWTRMDIMPMVTAHA